MLSLRFEMSRGGQVGALAVVLERDGYVLEPQSFPCMSLLYWDACSAEEVGSVYQKWVK